MTCASCGKRIPDDAAWCQFCSAVPTRPVVRHFTWDSPSDTRLARSLEAATRRALAQARQP